VYLEVVPQKYDELKGELVKLVLVELKEI